MEAAATPARPGARRWGDQPAPATRPRPTCRNPAYRGGHSGAGAILPPPADGTTVTQSLVVLTGSADERQLPCANVVSRGARAASPRNRPRRVGKPSLARSAPALSTTPARR